MSYSRSSYTEAVPLLVQAAAVLTPTMMTTLPGSVASHKASALLLCARAMQIIAASDPDEHALDIAERTVRRIIEERGSQ